MAMTIPKARKRTAKIFTKLRPNLSGLNRGIILKWAEKDSNLRRRKPADLQSAPVDRFGIDPLLTITV